jgi:chitodextrinase
MPKFGAWRHPAAKFIGVICVISVFAAGLSAADDTSAAGSGLVASYDFDAGSGSVLADRSGNGNDGVISGAAWSKGGKYGGALTFDGVDDWVTVADSSSLDLTKGMTIEAWVNPTALTGRWRTVAVKEQPGQLDYALYAHTNSEGPSAHVFVGGSDTYLREDSAIPAGTWTYLATTYDGSSIRLYVNGDRVQSRSARGSIATSTRPLRLGGNSVWDEFFKGSIDELRVYNRSLSSNAIRSDMRTAVGGGTSTPPPPPPPPADTTAPSTPTSLHATGSTPASISLAWNGSTDNVGVTGYGVYKGSTVAGNATSTTYTVSGLACGTSYTLAVDAVDAAGNRSAKTSITTTTASCAPPADMQAPTTPGNFIVVGTTGTTITVTWSQSLDNVGVTDYGLYRNNTLAGSTPGTSYTYGGLTCGTTYTLAVDAADAARNRSGKSTISASTAACPGPTDTQAPTTPTNLRATGSTTSSVSLAWTASFDNVGVTGYGAYNGTNRVGNPTGTSYTVTGLSCGTSYALAVDSVDAAGNRSGKATLNASTAACAPPADTTAPTVPGNFTVIGTTGDSVSVSWSQSIDNVGVTGYGLYRAGQQVGTASGTSFTYTGLTCGTGYSLAVDAADAAGNRSGKATISGSTAACPQAPPPSNGTANLWVDASGGNCARLSSRGGYADAQACGSLNAAYQAASAGDVVLIKGGTYPSQAISDRSNLALGSAVISMHPAPGENIVVDGYLDVRTHDLAIDGGDQLGVNEANRIQVNGISSSDQAVDFGWGNNSPRVTGNVVEDVHTRNVYFDDGSRGNTFRNGDVGPSDLGGENLCSDLVQSGNAQFTVEYNLVHDNLSSGCGGAHIDAFDLNPDDTGSVVRGNRIWWCGTQCIFTGDPGKLLVENNFIEETNACGGGCDGPQEIALMGDTVVRYNTVEGDDGYGCNSCSPTRPGNTVIYGNVFLSPYGGCAGGGVITASYDYNVFAPGGTSCGSHSKVCTPRLANGNLWTNVDQQADYHLASNDTCALGAGEPGDYPSQDLDGTARPQGAPDAGADEK